ncbi:MAG: hypothetical protein C5B47_06930 [Verrucomicrobia bacterium]|nr:MAG: hypothetical protein C5B47_06930 [Verrucomicrobiota bacterium]
MDLRNDQIAIVHAFSENLQNLADVTFPNHVEYASKHGYVVKTKEIVYPWDSPWEKIQIIQEVLADPNIRKVLWIDADAIFTNMELPLTQHLPDGKIVITCDAFGPNAGILWLTNCPEVRRLLQAVTMVRPMFRASPWNEQTALRHLFLHPPYDKLVTYVEQRQMNAYFCEYSPSLLGPPPNDIGKWQPGDFILHRPGIDNKVRIKDFKKVLSDIQASSLD